MSEIVLADCRPPQRRVTRLGKCSVCNAYDILRRTWCPKHYQRWVKYGDTSIVHTRQDTRLGKRPFTVSMWNRWLAEFNARSREPNTEFRGLFTRVFR